jgi:hypothetical protein
LYLDEKIEHLKINEKSSTIFAFKSDFFGEETRSEERAQISQLEARGAICSRVHHSCRPKQPKNRLVRPKHPWDDCLAAPSNTNLQYPPRASSEAIFTQKTL